MKKIILLLCVFLTLGYAHGKDFYVKAGAGNGNGSKEKPFKGIYLALQSASKGDVIHVAQGKYHGKLQAGFIIIPCRDLTLLGGYNDDFSERNPWKYLTIIERDPNSKARTFDRGLIHMDGDHANLVVDGFVLDAMTRNVYVGGSLDVSRSLKDPTINITSAGCQIRNCLIVNTAFGGVRMSGDRCSVTNCVFVNHVEMALDLYGTKPDTTFTVAGNTFVRTWLRYQGNAINIGTKCKVTMEKNIFAYQDEHAVSNQRNNPGHIMNKNLFFGNKAGCYIFFHAENKGTLVIKQVEDFSDSDLEESKENVEIDPKFKAPLSKIVDPKPVPATKKNNEDPFSSDSSQDPFSETDKEKEKQEDKKKGTFAPAISLEHALGYLEVLNKDAQEYGAKKDGPFPIVQSQAEEKTQHEYEAIDFYALFQGGPKYAEKAVKIQCSMVERGRIPSHLEGHIKGITNQTHTYVVLRVADQMKSGMDVVLGFVEKGSEAENFLVRKVKGIGRWGKPASRDIFHVGGIVVPVEKHRKNAIAIIIEEANWK